MTTTSHPGTGLLARLPGLLTGPGFVAIAACILVKVTPPAGSMACRLALGLVVFGVLWSALSLMLPQGRPWSFLRWCSMNLIILSALAGGIETIGRALKINFNALGFGARSDPRQAYPIWAREPDEPVPEVFFRHKGPAVWTGQPIRTLELLRRGTDNAYLNEPRTTIEYDSDGFRNPPTLTDWDAAVVGDSYTELGYLPYDQISSSVAAARTGLRLKNLGVCGTGLLSYARYLRNYGRAPSCKRVVYVMFEGNDVQDTTLEDEALDQFHLTGQRPCRDVGAETSFVRAAAGLIRSQLRRPRPQSYQNAWFQNGDQEIPVTISHELPVDPQAMTGMQAAAMKDGIRALAEEARNLHLTAALVYVPVNNRVYHGLLRFDDKLPGEVRDWRPHDLPAWVAALCREQNIEFYDSLPPLRAAAEKGRYVHNHILDCHVNAEGARLIGEVIATALKPVP